MGILGVLSCFLVNQKFTFDFIRIIHLRNFWNSTQVWFFTAIIYCYFLIYVIAKFIRCEKIRIILLLIGLGIWIIYCISSVKPVCWYNTILLFGVGYIWKHFGRFEKNNIIIALGGSLNIGLFTWAYGSEWYKQTVYATMVAIFFAYIAPYMEIRWKILKTIGKCSLEMYFVHSFIYMVIYRNLGHIDLIQNSISYYFVVVLCIVVAQVAYFFGNRIIKTLK